MKIKLQPERDKNGFMVEPGEDWNDQKSDETIKYMTKPKNISSIEPRRFTKEAAPIQRS